VDAARGAARKIVKAGEDAAQEIDREAIKTITEARTAFLDIDTEPAETSAPVPVGREVDIDENEPAEPARRATGRSRAGDLPTSNPRRDRRNRGRTRAPQEA
jgi:hypothetical protein